MSETEAIRWKQISAEAVAIVVSILLAFWIDAWWDGLKDRREEREILIGLEVEFVDLKERLDFWAQRNIGGMQQMSNICPIRSLKWIYDLSNRL